MRVGVLASGNGSTFQALVDALNVEGSPATVTTLVCNVPGAYVLERAAKAGVEAVVIDHSRYTTRADYDARVADELASRATNLVCLAGYMRLVTQVFLARFPGAVLNVHPALLPSFPGLHAPRQALAARVTITGCTVHYVDEGTDTGPIIAQASVPVLPDDDAASLTARIQREERRLFPAVVKAVATGRVTLEGRRVIRREVIA
ncbi:MAG: phosphoribosylglycinamide formyltransferase [Myxococcaceae bacterium]|jgi:phosphoribosylglycinamide formyltransferase-1|nr:phosphoribosylglycinamide formyltransferase [Myxococcaceae bacterium]MCA3014852.1 phosphoribosylglycinamide formyltransferase [Myxococcaceae bacterium]